jgi:hypothetical protein
VTTGELWPSRAETVLTGVPFTSRSIGSLDHLIRLHENDPTAANAEWAEVTDRVVAACDLALAALAPYCVQAWPMKIPRKVRTRVTAEGFVPEPFDEREPVFGARFGSTATARAG